MLALTLTATLASAQYSPVANIVEKWTNDANWVVQGNAPRVYTNQAMGASKIVSDPPLSGSIKIAANTGSSGGLFSGNYSNSAITHVSFDAKRVGVSHTAALCFRSASGNIWSRQFELPSTVGVWGHVEVPMTYSSDWTTIPAGDSVKFDFDRSQVVQIYIFDVFDGGGEQSVFIDNFSVVGPWEKGPMRADGVPG